MIREKTKDDVSPVSPPIVKTNGKPGVDYESLFEEWIRSGMDRENFLMAYGLNPKSSAVSDKTKTWTRDVQQAQRKIVRSKRNERSTKSRPQREIAEMWQIVQGWRTGQAEKDWEMAEKLRLHLALQLDSGIKTDRKTGEQSTSISSMQLNRLAEVAMRIQKMQRLALGMTTENVGIPTLPEPEPHVEAPKDGPQLPTYVVQVGKDGKFVTPKPRRIQ